MSLMSPQLTLTHNALNWMRPPKRATQQADGKAAAQKPKGKATQADLQVRCRATTSIERALDDYLQDHDGGNHSEKTLEWHRTPLGMRQHFLEGERESMQVEEVDAADISACFAYLRRIPGKQGKPPSERTIERLFENCSKYIDILALEANLSDFSNSL